MILVTGATGTVGGEVVDALVEQKEPVRALARTPRSSGFADGVEVVEGDLDRPENIAAALHGAHGVFLLAGFSDMAGVLDQIATADVERVVLLTSRCVVGGKPDNAITRMWLDAEDAVRASGLAWTILRPSGFQATPCAGCPSSGKATSSGRRGRDVPIASIDPADIAPVAAATLSGPGHEGRHRLSGPQPLRPASRRRPRGGARPPCATRRRRTTRPGPRWPGRPRSRTSTRSSGTTSTAPTTTRGCIPPSWSCSAGHHGRSGSGPSSMPRRSAEAGRSPTRRQFGGAIVRIGIIGAGGIGRTVGRLWAGAGHAVTVSWASSEERLREAAAQIGPDAVAERSAWWARAPPASACRPRPCSATAAPQRRQSDRTDAVHGRELLLRDRGHRFEGRESGSGERPRSRGTDLRQPGTGLWRGPVPRRPAVVDDRLAAGREPVADVERLRQAQLLELADVALERRRVAAELGGEVRRADLGRAVDDRQRPARPRSDGRRRVEAVQAGADLGELGLASVVAAATRSAGRRPPSAGPRGTPAGPPGPPARAATRRGTRAGPARVVLGDRGLVDGLDGGDLDQPDGGAHPGADDHARTVPAAEAEIDRSRLDPGELDRTDHHAVQASSSADRQHGFISVC